MAEREIVDVDTKEQDTLKPVESECGNGVDSEYVTLISSDGHQFILKRSYALLSTTMMTMLDNPGRLAETVNSEIHFKEIPSHILFMVCKFLMCKAYFDENKSFCESFHIPENMALELLMAANFLGC